MLNNVTKIGLVRVTDLRKRYATSLLKLIIMSYIKNKDGFTWLIVTHKAKEVFNSSLFELYEVDENCNEHLCETMDDLILALENGNSICIEVGFV